MLPLFFYHNRRDEYSVKVKSCYSRLETPENVGLLKVTDLQNKQMCDSHSISQFITYSNVGFVTEKILYQGNRAVVRR